MSHLAKLNLKTVNRNVPKDPVIARREKLAAAIAEQCNVLKAALTGTAYTVETTGWQQNEAGERVKVSKEKLVRAWFFARDGGYYVQCRYGSRVLMINGKSNAVFVDALADVQAVLDAFAAATASGEFDKAILLATKGGR